MRRVRLCSDCGINIDLRHNRSIRCELCQDIFGKARARIYIRAYRKEFLEQVRATEKKYRDANKEKRALNYKVWYDANQEHLKSHRKNYYEKNRERILSDKLVYNEARREIKRAYDKSYYKANKKRILAKGKAYSIDNLNQSVEA